VRRQIKEAGLACLTFSGVVSLYAMPITMLLASPRQRVVATAIYDTPHMREVVFDLSPLEPASDDAVINVVDNIGKAPIIVRDVEIINLDVITEVTTEVVSDDENINLSISKIWRETINLTPPTSTTSQAETPKKSKKRRRRRNRYADCQDNEGIAATNNGFSVGREVVDYYAHITRYRKLGRVSWHRGDDGERDGFKVRRINCDLREAGIRNGDIVNTVNGRTVQTIPQAISLWFKVRRKNRIVLEIIRRGKPMTINYQLT